MIPELRVACSVCESGAVIERYKHIVFTEGTLRAFNGAVSVQAPSSLDESESFAVNEERLMQALSACAGEGVEVKVKPEHLVLKQGKLTVRVRKLDAAAVFHDPVLEPAKKARIKSPDFQEALRAVAPFMSSDASRPWTTSILFKDGFAWATNNLALVRYPLATPIECCIPAAAVPVLESLPSIDWVAAEKERIVVASGTVRIATPAASAPWPETIASYFAKAPKKLPLLPPDLLEAAKVVEKFAERFVSLKPEKVEGKLATIESEYEIEVKDGKGAYPAKLLLLILNHATHADFSTYPAPIFFAGEKLRGVAVGARPEAA